MKLYTLKEIRKIAGTSDIYRTKAGYIYVLKNGKKEYVKINQDNQEEG